MGTSPGPAARRGSLLSWVLVSFLGVAIGAVGQWFLDMDAGLAENDVANRVYGLFMAGLLGLAVANIFFVISIGADKASMRQWLARHRVWVLAGALGGTFGTVAGWAAGTAVDRAGIFDGSDQNRHADYAERSVDDLARRRGAALFQLVQDLVVAVYQVHGIREAECHDERRNDHRHDV